MVTVLDIITKDTMSNLGVNLVCKAGRKGLNKEITRTINRPGLALKGEFIGFGENRIQLFGKGEIEFLCLLDQQGRLDEILKEFFSHQVSCCIVSHSLEQSPPQLLIDYCEKFECPLLYSELSSADLTMNLFRLINDLFAPKKVFHGVLVEVYDIGVFIRGESGIGKSEIALELIEKGKYRFVADDVVLMKKIDNNTITGSPASATQLSHNLEIRGLGFVNVSQIYGVGTVLNSKKVSLVIDLKHWNQSKVNDDRLERIKYTEILGVQIPCYELHVKAGRNMSLLIETAAIKHRLVAMGFHGKENPYLW